MRLVRVDVTGGVSGSEGLSPATVLERLRPDGAGPSLSCQAQGFLRYLATTAHGRTTQVHSDIRLSTGRERSWMLRDGVGHLPPGALVATASRQGAGTNIPSVDECEVDRVNSLREPGTGTEGAESGQQVWPLTNHPIQTGEAQLVANPDLRSNGVAAYQASQSSLLSSWTGR